MQIQRLFLRKSVKRGRIFQNCQKMLLGWGRADEPPRRARGRDGKVERTPALNRIAAAEAGRTPALSGGGGEGAPALKGGYGKVLWAARDD